jgi:hypothetical protein
MIHPVNDLSPEEELPPNYSSAGRCARKSPNFVEWLNAQQELNWDAEASTQ